MPTKLTIYTETLQDAAELNSVAVAMGAAVTEIVQAEKLSLNGKAKKSNKGGARYSGEWDWAGKENPFTEGTMRWKGYNSADALEWPINRQTAIEAFMEMNKVTETQAKSMFAGLRGSECIVHAE